MSRLGLFQEQTIGKIQCGAIDEGRFSSLSVCPQRNSKTNEPNVFKFGIGNDLDIPYPRSDKVWGLKGERSRL